MTHENRYRSRRAIGVFCASSGQVPRQYVEVARETGMLIAQRGFEMVFGGTDAGLMTILADAAAEAGGHVVGVVPGIFNERGITYHGATEIVSCQDLRDRKQIMTDRSDAFVALPGGLGTLDEIADVLASRGLRLHEKPLILLNAFGFYDALLNWFRQIHRDGFISKPFDELLTSVATPREAIEAVERQLAGRS